MRYLIPIFLFLASPAFAAEAATYYCDPVDGNTADNNGLSAETAWGTLQSLIESDLKSGTVQEGDTVKLMDGFHGHFNSEELSHENCRNFNDYITIEAEDGAVADVSWIKAKNCIGWKFIGLRISPDLNTPSDINTTDTSPNIVWVYGGGWPVDRIVVKDCNIFTVEDTSGWDASTDVNANNWGYNDNNGLAWDGIESAAPNSVYQNNLVRNVQTGIIVGEDSTVKNNRIIGIGADGIRYFKGDCLIEDNYVVDFYRASTNSAFIHSDCIQSWGAAAPNTIIRRNYCRSRLDTSRDANTVGGLQGFFLQESTKSGTIENNVILATNTSHGMQIGCDEDAGNVVYDMNIYNNTVLMDYYTQDEMDATGYGYGAIHWGNDTNTVNVVARNNIVRSVVSHAGVTASNNMDIRDVYDPSVEFVNWANGDVNLVSDSNFIDAGTNTDAPSEDLEKRSRPQGLKCDVGAYEYVSDSNNRNPTLITSWADLQAINTGLSADYVLTTNLDEDSPGYNTYASPTANDGNGFDPIGDSAGNFTGKFNGQGHTVSDLYINRPSEMYIGLFGYVSEAEISKIGVIDYNISGDDYVGGLVGRVYSATVSNSYSTAGSVSGDQYVGGLIGKSILSTISDSYSTGSVSGNLDIGGLIGDESGSTTSNSFWDTETSGQATSEGGTGKTTKEMQDPFTFDDAGWDFDDVWYWNDPMGNRARLTAPFSNKMRGRRRGGQGGYMKLRDN